MELIYLYIEDYKNIKNQGFNFSSKFTCKYDEVKKILQIDENNNHIENFFAENINITAIVGENGSGKSSVLEAILKIVEDEIYENFILVYFDDGLKYISNFEFVADIEKSEDFKEKRNIFAYINIEHKHYAFRRYSIVEIDKIAVANILAVELGKIESSFIISSFMYIPNKIEIKLREPEQLINESINFFSLAKREKIKEIFESIEDRYHQHLIICYGREKGIDVDIEILRNKEELKTKISSFVDEKYFHKYFLKLTNEKIFDISGLTEKQKDIYFRKDGYRHFFDFDMIDEKQRRFNNLSHGEQMLFGQLLNLYFFSQGNKDSLIFVFDEPEIALHPNWQKNYMKEVISLLKKLDKKYQFIVTSHSPFILSDIPKQNIIFLKDGKQVDAMEKKQTFGANIHTLLADGFFMDGGLMGEFAKSKIEEVIKYLNDKNLEIKSKEEAQKIINIIGEPILKNQLQKMLDSKNLSEVDKIKQDIKALQNRLEELENGKN